MDWGMSWMNEMQKGLSRISNRTCLPCLELVQAWTTILDVSDASGTESKDSEGERVRRTWLVFYCIGDTVTAGEHSGGGSRDGVLRSGGGTSQDGTGLAV